MRLLFPMTYYRPYVSGPIIYVENVAAELARRGHQITILCSRHAPESAEEEDCGAFRVVRLPVFARVSKGVLMRRFISASRALMHKHDAVLIQAPQFESAVLAGLARLEHRPSILTYHCDVQLPPGLVNAAITHAMTGIHLAAASMAGRIAAYTDDYARHSPVMRRFPDKVRIVPPPVELAPPPPAAVQAFRERLGLTGSRVIGISGRLSAEKGFHVLLEAAERLAQNGMPEIRILHAGEARAVVGEHAYRETMLRRLAGSPVRWDSLGVLDRSELAAFYTACNVTVLPSLNRTESFGLVQVESMLCGTPVIAADLPGVRVPVRTTGMGEIVGPGDAAGLAAAIEKVLSSPGNYVAPRLAIEQAFSPARTADGYEEILAELTR